MPSRSAVPADSAHGALPAAVDDTLRVIACGSVDDGKSTLIGRLLFESQMIYDDQLAELEADSKKFGTRGAQIDLALALDGLAAEREQGITIDVAHRYFTAEGRYFIVADAPGHEQYTRNMITAASTADVAVILIDARKGLLTQTRRHSYLISLLGVRHALIAVNKMDLVDHSREVFERIESDYRAFATEIRLDNVVCVPICALDGDNVMSASDAMPWYRGPTLMQYLRSVSADDDAASKPFRMPVQMVMRPGPDFRGFAGSIVSGSVRPGDSVRILPSGNVSTVSRIVTFDGDLDVAGARQAVTLLLADEIDIGRGDVIAAAQSPPGIADHFEATIIWMADEAMIPARRQLLKIGTRTVGATLTPPAYKIDVNTLQRVAADTLRLNEIGVCNVHLDQPIPFDPYAVNRDTGGFIVIDRISNATIAAGLLHSALRRSQDIHWQAIEVDKRSHARLKGHRPCIVWLTGLSGSGKSTIANLVEKKLHALGLHTYTLDGDNVRHGLNRDLGFTGTDRVENVRRVGEVARLMVDAGLVVLVSFISPFRDERRQARALVAADEFCEVFVDAPLEVAEKRDTKGLYRKARRGELKNFTGIDSPYERPEAAEVTIDSVATPPDAAADTIIEHLRAMRIFELR